MSGTRNWTVHNLIAHPVSELAWLVGARRFSGWIHDRTVPNHPKGEGRG